MSKTGMMEMREVKTMSPVIALDQHQAWRLVRREIVHQVEQEMIASEAQRRSSVSIHRSPVYRLLKRIECEGEETLIQRRHGHPVKLRGEVFTFVLDYCQSHSSAASYELQHLVAERFGTWAG